MKNFTLTLLSFVITTAAIAQFGVSFPTSDATWVTRKSSLNPVTNTVEYNHQAACLTNTQITVAGKVYNQVKRCDAINSLGAFREAGNIVYFLAPDSTNEYIAYDFNLNVGETISSVIFMDGYPFYEYPYFLLSGTLTVSAVSTVNYNGVNRKKIEFVDSPATWIEGIGNTTGFLLDNESNVGGYGLELLCMSISNNSIYPVAAVGACVRNVGLTKLQNDKLEFTIAPNPSNGSFFVTTNEASDKMDIRITELNGKVVAQFNDHSSSEKIAVDLKSGVYILNVTTEGRTSNTQLVID